MISFVIGDLFQIRAEAIVNTVNCVGVQGAGVALGCKTRWPAAYAALVPHRTKSRHPAASQGDTATSTESGQAS